MSLARQTYRYLTALPSGKGSLLLAWRLLPTDRPDAPFCVERRRGEEEHCHSRRRAMPPDRADKPHPLRAPRLFSVHAFCVSARPEPARIGLLCLSLTAVSGDEPITLLQRQ